RRAGGKEAGICLAVLVAVAAAWTVPFAVVAPHGVWSSLWGQADRPLQIESLGASLLLAAHQLWALPLTEVPSHGSDNLVGHTPHLLASLQSVGAAALLVGVWIGFARGPAERDRLLRYAAAAVCAFVALNKVLSPQYLIWLIALVPLVAGRRGALAASLYVAAAVLTQLWFPRHYIALVYGLDPRASWFVVARDLVLVALLVTLVTKPHVQLFTAAYRGRFDPTRPRLGYLGDPGTCTNVAGATGSTLRYSFVAPAATRLVVEVESCGAGTSVPPYTLQVGDA